ncbi:hypothetical protein ACUSIJ_01330 [Pseudochelatococcus sp. B33]
MTAADAGSTRQPLDVMGIFPEIAQITDEGLRRAVIEVWEELWAMSPWHDIDEVPTNVDIPYPTRPHNQCVMSMALAVADAIERHHGISVNRDHLIAAAALQDASKVVEYQPPELGGRHTELGKTYPHAFWAAHLALSKGVPDAVVHIILTHTPQSPTFPTSLEGKILYYVDQIDVLAIHKDRWRKELFITK